MAALVSEVAGNSHRAAVSSTGASRVAAWGSTADRREIAGELSNDVSATGGEYYAELSQSAIESAYSRLTQVARNQYTLGYNTRATAASNYRQIEVRVHRPGLKVYAKDGYYPLPPQRPATTPPSEPQ